MKIHKKVHRTFKESEGFPLTTLYDPLGMRGVKIFHTEVRCIPNVNGAYFDPETGRIEFSLEEAIRYFTNGAELIEINSHSFNELFRLDEEINCYNRMIECLNSKIRDTRNISMGLAGELIDQLY